MPGRLLEQTTLTTETDKIGNQNVTVEPLNEE